MITKSPIQAMDLFDLGIVIKDIYAFAYINPIVSKDIYAFEYIDPRIARKNIYGHSD